MGKNSSAQPMKCREELWEDSVGQVKGRGRTQTYEEESGRENIPQSLIPPPQSVEVQGVRHQEPMLFSHLLCNV